MELVKKVVNMLVENRIDFKIQHDNEFEVCIEFDSEGNMDIDYLTINIHTNRIVVSNYNTGLWLRLIDSNDELKQFTPFKVTE